MVFHNCNKVLAPQLHRRLHRIIRHKQIFFVNNLVFFVIYSVSYVVSKHDTVSILLGKGWIVVKETEINYASIAFPASAATGEPVLRASPCISSSLFHDLYYGNSAYTTSWLTFDNNAADAAEWKGGMSRRWCHGSGNAARWVSQVRHTGEPGTLPASSASREMCGLLPRARLSTIGEIRWLLAQL